MHLPAPIDARAELVHCAPMKIDRVVNSRAVGLVVAAVALCADQLAKWFVTNPLALRSRGVIDLLPIFSLRWAENSGVSMSLLKAEGTLSRWALLAMTGAIAGAVAVWLWRDRDRINGIALGLILGGALGNITDRLRLGYVVDFLDLHFNEVRPFQIFNIADCMISIGVVALLLRAGLHRKKTSRTQPRPR